MCTNSRSGPNRWTCCHHAETITRTSSAADRGQRSDARQRNTKRSIAAAVVVVVFRVDRSAHVSRAVTKSGQRGLGGQPFSNTRCCLQKATTPLLPNLTSEHGRTKTIARARVSFLIGRPDLLDVDKGLRFRTRTLGVRHCVSRACPNEIRICLVGFRFKNNWNAIVLGALGLTSVEERVRLNKHTIPNSCTLFQIFSVRFLKTVH